MFEQIILGIIQGLTEWLPVSSKAMLILTEINIFGSTKSLEELIKIALLLHIGTLAAAILYFRKEIGELVATLLRFNKAPKEDKNLFIFLLVTTVISGLLGFGLLKIIDAFEEQMSLTGKAATAIIGLLLIGTGILQLKSKNIGKRTEKQVVVRDAIYLGFAQGLAAIPGFSRSGTTVSTLLLRHFEKQSALRLSFLASLPIIFAGNIILNFDAIRTINVNQIMGIFASFIFGYITIDGLLKVAKKVNFGYFVILFGLLTILSTLLGYSD